MNIYEARYNNALKMANKINDLIKNGYLVLQDGEKFPGFTITEDGDIIEKYDNISVG